MIRIFLDTEFTDLVVDAKLISIALVSEDGRHFYAELTDTYRRDQCSPFVQDTVLPLLEGGATGKAWSELRVELYRWIRDFEQSVQIATDSVAWDWPWIQKLYQDEWSWPQNLHGKPLSLTYSYLIDYDAYIRAAERAYAQGLRRHNALDDAKANRLGWLASGGDYWKSAK